MSNTFFVQVGKNIQQILQLQGKTQQYLAEELHISKQVMSKIIAGAKAINVSEISKIASVLHVSTDSLLCIQTIQPTVHHFSFMGQVKSKAVKEKIAVLQTVIDELLLLEECADD